MHNKNTLRSEYEQKRSLFVAQHEKDWLQVQQQVNENISRVLHELPKGLILSYQPLRSEADPSSIVKQQANRRWAYPKIQGDHLEFYEASSIEQFEKGQLGILEPIPEKCKKIELKEVQAVLIPGVAFDLNGQRLGRGKGHYDRALALMPQASLRIGVGFSCQLSFQPLPKEDHDQKMHFIVTEELIWCPRWENWMPGYQQQEMKG